MRPTRLIATALLVMSPLAANSSLIGDTVDASFNVIFGDWSLDATSNIVGFGGPEFTISISGGRGILIDIQDAFIDFTYNNSASGIGISTCDNDCSITIAGINHLITGLSLTEFDSGAGGFLFGGNTASFTSHSVTLFVDGVWDSTDRVRLDLRFATVPEPGMLSLVGAGLLGVGLMRRRRLPT